LIRYRDSLVPKVNRSGGKEMSIKEE